MEKKVVKIKMEHSLKEAVGEAVKELGGWKNT